VLHRTGNGSQIAGAAVGERDDVEFDHGVVLQAGIHPPYARAERLEEMVA